MRSPWVTRRGGLPVIVGCVSVVVLSSLSSISCGDTVVMRACTSNGCINTIVLGNKIMDALQDNVVGYQLEVRCVAPCNVGHSVSWGFARTAANPPEHPMGLERMQIASLSKTITAVAVLKLLAANPNVSVTSPVWPYLPGRWQKGPNVEQILFEDLLRHTSGFTGYHGVTYQDLQEMWAGGPESAVGSCIYASRSECYRNENFALFRIIIPYLADFNDIGLTDAELEVELAETYESYVRDNVLALSGISWASCREEDYPVAYYRFSDDPQPAVGAIFGRDLLLECGPGGWFMSAHDYAQFLHDLFWTETILSQTSRDEMLGKQLGLWAPPLDVHQCYSLTGGSSPGGNRVETFYWACPELGIQIVLFNNSYILDPTADPAETDPEKRRRKAADIIEDAFKAAWEPTVP